MRFGITVRWKITANVKAHTKEISSTSGITRGTKKKSPIFLDEAIKSGEEISEELLVQLPSPREDFETRILSKQKVEAFFETLDGKDKRILQMRMDGCTLEQIAKFAGYKTPSAVYKRIQKIATAYEDFISKKYGEFLDIHSKKNKHADKSLTEQSQEMKM